MTAGEACLMCPGNPARPVVLMLPPLFDEANRMRRTIVQTMRSLSALGVGSYLPDLPGQNDSLLRNEDATLMLWRAAVAQIAASLPQPFVVVSWRGGALIDDAALGASGWWRMAPQSGSAILKGLIRTRMAGDKESGHPTTSDALRTTARAEGMVELAGYRLSATMLDELEAATPAAVGPLRTVTPGDIGGSALWLRAEPGEDAAMVSGMANDIVRWLDDLAPVVTPPPSPASLPVAVADTLVEDAMGLLHARRQQFSFDIGDVSCAVTVDRGSAFKAGLLILSGGNEIRAGAHRGMAELADRLAQAGHSVLRFDRRGIGDSEGDNRGFEHSAEELAAAVQLFRTVCGGMSRIVAFGNCDAAAALLLHHSTAELDRLVLANVWTIETFEAAECDAPAQAAALPPAAAIRARYAQKLRDPREWLRLVRGGVDLQKLWRGLRASRSRPPSGLADRLGVCLAATNVPATILIAENDGTALAFMEQWRGPAFAAARAAHTARILAHPTGSHGFADDDAREWLFARLLEALGVETD